MVRNSLHCICWNLISELVYQESTSSLAAINSHNLMQVSCKIRAPDKKGTEDNSKISFFCFSTKTYVVTPHYSCLDETVVMVGHKVCFNGEILLIIPQLFLLPFLSGALAKY